MPTAPTSASAGAEPKATTEASGGEPVGRAGSASLVRNTFYLTAAQAITIPISVLSNAMTGRYFGPTEFGYLYVATTLCTFAILGVEWGLQGALPALVARDRANAASYLGTSLAWRAGSSLVVSLVLAVLCALLGYERGVYWAVALAYPLAVLNSVAAGFKDTIRGFERTDIPAIAHVAQQLMTALVMVPVLVLGGHLRALLISQIIVAGLTVVHLRRSLKAVGLTKLSVSRERLRPLLEAGTPFVVFGLVLVLGPNLNAAFLTKLVPPPVVGWYGVSQRLIGLLLFPASALVGALYPTLCRLHTEDHAEFVRVSRSSLYGVSLLAIPAAVGSGMFPEVGVAIFGTQAYSGASDHLRVMALFVLLVYFSMPLGTAILASMRQRAWTVVQCASVVVSLVGSPFLVPYFQRRMGNGAVGTCVALVISEAFVVSGGIFLSPKGLFDRGLLKALSLSGLAGAAMIAVAWSVKRYSLILAIPASLIAYAAVAWFSGAVQPSTAEMIKSKLGRRFARARA